MDVSCYTVRPTPDSGWLTFFELAHLSRGPGFFLVVGPAAVPATGPDAEQRRQAQDTARSIVNAYKSLRDPVPAEWMTAVRRLVGTCRIPLEFGAVLGAGSQIYFFVDGRVRLVPLTTAARHRWERDLPKPGELSIRHVEGGDRFLLARLPGETAGTLPSLDLLEGIEREGNRDGALILSFHGASALAEPTTEEPAVRRGGMRLVRGRPAPVAEPIPAPVVQPAPAPAAEPAPPPAATSAPPPVAPPPPPATPVTPPPEAVKAPVAAAPPEMATPAVVTPPKMATPTVVTPAPAETLLPAEASREGVSAPETPLEESSVAGEGDGGARRRIPHLLDWVLLLLVIAALAVWFVWIRPRQAERPVASRQAAGADSATPAAALRDTIPVSPLVGPPVSPAEAGLLWTARLPGAVTGAPLPAGQRLVVGCRDGWLYGLDTATGDVAWRLQGQKGFGGNLSAGDSLVFAGCFDGVVRAVDPRAGSLAWQFATAGRIVAAPVVGEGRVMVTSYDHTAYGLDERTGHLLWKTRLGGILWATPALGRKLLFVPGLDGTLTALNPRWGSVAWRFKAPGEIYSSPAATESLVVFGCEDGLAYAVEPEYGQLRWKVGLGRPAAGGVGARDGIYYLGDDGGILHALSGADGREVWSYRAGAAIKSTPVFDGEAVIFSSHDGYIHAVNRRSGEKIGRIPLDSPMAASPALASNCLYIGVHDGRVVGYRMR